MCRTCGGGSTGVVLRSNYGACRLGRGVAASRRGVGAEFETPRGTSDAGQNRTCTLPRSPSAVSKNSFVLKPIMPAMTFVGRVWVALL